MSTRKQVKKANKNLYKQIGQLPGAVIKGLIKRLLRSLLIVSRRVRLSKSGFVLPTVVMVILVVMLLTTAILLRSFDRSKNASTVRVNQAVLNAAAPALDRARAKLDALFADPTLPRGTPSDFALNNALNRNRYMLGDETRLKLVKEVNGQPDIQANTVALENDDTLTTAWRFPIDTDNNGRFDSYTLYGIYFRSPTRDSTGQFNRLRRPLEARTPPMEGSGTSGGQCASATDTSSSSVGDSNWYKAGAQLIKNFFVYIATVPITDISSLSTDEQATHEKYTGNRGFSALELQQDRTRIPLNNNAVWYDDDLEVSNATSMRLNGRVATNSNLMVAGNTSSNQLIFYQISDPDSCYYEQENSKILVGGNVANGDIGLSSDEGQVQVHRFQGKATAPAGQSTGEGISSTNKTTTEAGGRFVGYNNRAYSGRIGLMVQAALNLHGTAEPTDTSVEGVARYPKEVKERFKQRFNDENETKEPKQILIEELETYFEDHTRRVPYKEVSSSTSSGVGSYTVDNVLGSTNPIRPPDTWMVIEDPTSGSVSAYTKLSLKFGTNNTMFLPATEPTQQQTEGKENLIGDRILVGNNLPFFWPKFTTGTFDKFADSREAQSVKNLTTAVNWNNTSIPRTRQSQLQLLPNLGSVEHDGFWETEAAKQPAANENTGGLRVITGAGIYIDGVTTALGGTGERTTNALLPKDSFLPEPALNTGVTAPPKFTTATITTNNDNIIVWPDLMPMWNGISQKGDLQMRATAVYHYKQGSSPTPPSQVDPNQIPIACVSSYYDPSNQTNARNRIGLPDVSAIYDTDGNGTKDRLADGSTPLPAVDSNNGQSNNGVTYNAPYTNDAGRIAAVVLYRLKLNRQARAIFPTGRIVNEPLRKALSNLDANKTRSLGNNAAIDTAICALKILDGTLNVQSSPNVPHGAIKEAAFLNGRQVKSLNNLGSDNTRIAEASADLTNRYTLPLEQRQPLEIRVTELELNLLRTQTVGTSSGTGSTNNQEYLLPNSGIIYATRDDALSDLSDNTSEPAVVSNTEILVSPTDFKLDSTRRPNGIRLINGSNLARTNTNLFRVAEKGFILATNLPTYVEGNFNLHKDPSSNTLREEFTEKLEEVGWSNFYTRANNPDPNFACRRNQPGCADSGDQWRPATIISDAQTLLSSNFLDGFRNQGDYDLNNNQGNSAVENRLKNGFWNNNFVTSAGYWNAAGTDGFPTTTSRNSYLTNGVTSVQRRVNSHEYVMEICRKLPVSECTPDDWVVGYDVDANGTLSLIELKIKARDIPIGSPGVLAGALVSGTTARLAGDMTQQAVGSGTTIPPKRPEDQRYARRIAFLRNISNNLLNASSSAILPTSPSSFDRRPVPIGINGDGKVARFPSTATTLPRLQPNALWYRTTTSIATSGLPTNIRHENNMPLFYITSAFLDQQPLLVPILQIHSPTGTPGSSPFAGFLPNRWLQIATTTTANAAFVSGDTPSRSDLSERSGGLHNFIRFLEDWSSETTTDQTARISGSFIQYNKSSYDSASFYPVEDTLLDASAGLFYTLTSNQASYLSNITGNIITGFKYRGGISEFRGSYYYPPVRAYGFDVALLSQSPDLFAQRFTVVSTARPNEYFREVNQDDPWIETLLCAAEASDGKGEAGATFTTAAIPARPSTCPSLPYPPNP